jgi:hypothetical protein
MPNDLQRLALETAAAADPGRLCFADEVGIDFPSVRAAVTRMREGFLASGCGERALDVHISLSCHEARRGREVLVTLPVRRTCAACGGRGEVWNDACSECCGLGDALDYRDVQVGVPPGVRDGTRVRLTVSGRQVLVTRVDLCISVR